MIVIEEKTIALVPADRCTGCGACGNICPVNAISMEYDAEGFLYPRIDEKICVRCGKCAAVCPEMDYEKTEALRHSKGACYAVMASDEIRWMSSSGGLFTLLAGHVLERGGVAFGAAWTDDCMSVHHIGVESAADLQKLRSSKYVQSGMEACYREAKAALAEKRAVLFTGCPCQIAGLYRYLGHDDENLITADIVCHGANSTYAYRSYLLKKTRGKAVADVDFRRKDPHGWNTNLYLQFSDGSLYIETPEETKKDWGTGFLRGVINRKCCYTCHYTQFGRVADITMGDFWKVTQINPDWHDKKGTSLALVNSEKGRRIFDMIRPQMKLCAETSIDEEFARKANGQLVRPTRRHPGRSVFFARLPQTGYHAALNAAVASANAVSAAKAGAAPAKTAADAPNPPSPEPRPSPERLAPADHYDVGITGYWWSSNYGSVATYYALYKLVESLGLRPILLDRPEKETHGDGLDVFSRLFMERRTTVSESLGWNELERFNGLCDAYMIGSDQVWGPGAVKAYQYFFFLDFIRPEKKKIAYAASFGEHFNVGEEIVSKAKACVEQFDAVSVREYQAVDICREKFGVSAQWVMDPVFLADRTLWDALADESRQSVESVLGEKRDYLLAYIINASEEKRAMLLEASKRLNLPLLVILHGNPRIFRQDKKIMNLPHTLENVGEEEWVRFIKDAKYVITDSHHGSAFSMLYQKPFICCSDKKWGQSRYESLFGLLGLKERQSVTTRDMLERKLLETEVDYAHVDAVLERRRGQSLRWLMEALQDKQAAFMYELFERNRVLTRRVETLEKRLNGSL